MYQQMIREDLASIGRIGTDPRHIEAWMRLERGTLDALSARQFRAEVRAAAECVDASSSEVSERLAQSYGI